MPCVLMNWWHKETGGCFTNISQVFQNDLSNFLCCRNTSYENFKIKLRTCAQSHALGTCTRFQLEILTINVHIFTRLFWRTCEILVKQDPGHRQPYVLNFLSQDIHVSARRGFISLWHVFGSSIPAPYSPFLLLTMAVPFSNTKLRVPQGFQNVLECLAREVLRNQPGDIYAFGAVFFENLMKQREGMLVLINSLRAKFLRQNINIYLHFLSFLHTNKTQVSEITPRVRQGPAYST